MVALPAGVELGDYRILHPLGQGGFGITYLAEQISTGQKVVIKENLPGFCAFRHSTRLVVGASNPNDPLREYEKYLTDFVKEARLLSSLKHPNIVRVQEAFESLGTAYYVMPWVGGRDLRQSAPSHEEISEDWLAPILRQLLDALEYLHERNIYHRDVKPANILMDEDGRPVIIDFGTARNIVSERSATMVGSPGYSPIEQISAKGKRGPWTDVYSLGATCYRLITGAAPPESVERMAADEDPFQPLSGRPELKERFSDAFLQTVDKALELRARNRWQTVPEWVSALPAAAEPDSAEQAPPPPEETVPPKAQKKPSSTGCGCMIPALYLLGSAVLGIMWFIGLNDYDVLELSKEDALAVQRELLNSMESLESRQTEISGQLENLREELDEGTRLKESLKSINQELKSPPPVEAERRWPTAAAPETAAQPTETPQTPAASSKEDKKKQTAKAKAAAAREAARKKLAAKGINPEDYDRKLLELYGKYDMVKLLVAAGANANAVDGNGRTPLLLAASNNKSNSVKALLDAPGIDVNKVGRDGLGPMDLAIEKGYSSVVKYLIKAPGLRVRNRMLEEAARLGHSNVVKYLLTHSGINVNGGMALLEASKNGHTSVVRLLLAAPGINVNKADSKGCSPLFWAAFNGHISVVKLLLAVPGIDVLRENNKGWRVSEHLRHSTNRPDSIRCIELIEAKMDRLER